MQIQMPKQTQIQIHFVRHVAGAACPFVLPGSCNYLFIMHTHTYSVCMYQFIHTHMPTFLSYLHAFGSYLFHTINYTYLSYSVELEKGI